MGKAAVCQAPRIPRVIAQSLEQSVGHSIIQLVGRSVSRFKVAVHERSRMLLMRRCPSLHIV